MTTTATRPDATAQLAALEQRVARLEADLQLVGEYLAALERFDEEEEA